MTRPAADALVSTQWLHDHLSAPDIRIVDATWYAPASRRNARTDHDQAHIPGAVFFDIDDIAADDRGDLPHMMPDSVKFSSKMRRLGIGDGNKVVVYAQSGMASAACRGWWMLRHFGHEDVAVLDGGLPKWQAENRPVTDQPTLPRERHFTARANSFLLRDLAQIRANIDQKREQVIDARAAARFTGEGPEPWGDAGHIPGSINLPFETLIDPQTGTMKPVDALRAAFEAAGVDLNRPIVTTCGSGVTACVLTLGLYLIGHKQSAVYDGSWAEWVRHPDTPKATGSAA